MPFYPKRLREVLASDGSRSHSTNTSGRGTSANFLCGCAVTFYLTIDAASEKIEQLTFTSNGCGYMIAAALSLSNFFQLDSLAELNGLEEDDLIRRVTSSLESVPKDRFECIRVATQALRASFADHRNRRIEEFRGERALVCTCFGVSEDTIEQLATQGTATTVKEVADACRAGAGCGSCLMIIQEILDEHLHKI
jgi:NifU-like protein